MRGVPGATRGTLTRRGIMESIPFMTTLMFISGIKIC